MKFIPGHFKFKAKFFEIYNEVLTDLLNTDPKAKSIVISNGKVANLQFIDIQSTEQFNEILRDAFDRRKVSATLRNSGSSRSHAVIQIEMEGLDKNSKNQVIQSNIMFLDLAGCENANDHLNDIENEKRQEEMANINKSVSNFRTVIESLKKKRKQLIFEAQN